MASGTDDYRVFSVLLGRLVGVGGAADEPGEPATVRRAPAGRTEGTPGPGGPPAPRGLQIARLAPTLSWAIPFALDPHIVLVAMRHHHGYEGLRPGRGSLYVCGCFC